MKKMKLKDGVNSGFTLVEMLLVVAVLATLIGLLAPAILKSFKVASEKSAAMEAQLLQNAIVEYWHDQKKWPLPAGEGISGRVGDVKYTVTYRDDNDKVFNLLLNVDYGGSKKDYIETANHLTTAEPPSGFPAYAAARFKHVVEGIEGVKQRADKRPLVYWTEVQLQGKDGTERALKPFTVSFDLLNNTVSVKP